MGTLNILTANVNVTSAPYSEGTITFYIVDSKGNSTSTTDLVPGESKRINGIAKGGYKVYAKSKSVRNNQVVLIIDDFILKNN